MGDEAAAHAPPQAHVDGAVRQGASGGQYQPQLATWLRAVVTLASRTPCANAAAWHGALRCLMLSALSCTQEGSLRQGRCPLEERPATTTGQTVMQQMEAFHISKMQQRMAR